MQDSPIKFISTTLPEGTCYTTEQMRFNGFAAALQGFFPGNVTLWNYGNSVPTADNQDKPWLRLNANGSLDRVYIYFNGNWVSPHAIQDNAYVAIWTSDLTSLALFDGGDNNAPGDASGPMWEEVVALRAKFPLGAGTLPSTTVVAIGETGGEENHTLLLPEVPKHQHAVGTGSGQAGNNTEYIGVTGSGSTTALTTAVLHQSNTTYTGGAADGSTTPHNTMPPYLGVTYIRRSSRIFYKV